MIVRFSAESRARRTLGLACTGLRLAGAEFTYAEWWTGSTAAKVEQETGSSGG